MMPVKIDKMIRSSRKTMALQVDDQANVIVRVPLRMSQKEIDNFITNNANWIVKQKALAEKRLQESKPKFFQNDEEFWYLGEKYPLRLIEEPGDFLRFDHYFQLAISAKAKAHRLFVQWYKQQALARITERVEFYEDKMNVNYRQIKITSAKKRWGSCSSGGKLSFSWRLIMAPSFVVDYIVVHELAHLKHLNHSQRFWRLVATSFPDYKISEQWLKDNGHLLNL